MGRKMSGLTVLRYRCDVMHGMMLLRWGMRLSGVLMLPLLLWGMASVFPISLTLAKLPTIRSPAS